MTNNTNIIDSIEPVDTDKSNSASSNYVADEKISHEFEKSHSAIGKCYNLTDCYFLHVFIRKDYEPDKWTKYVALKKVIDGNAKVLYATYCNTVPEMMEYAKTLIKLFFDVNHPQIKRVLEQFT